jgi:hypothetical protein
LLQLGLQSIAGVQYVCSQLFRRDSTEVPSIDKLVGDMKVDVRDKAARGEAETCLYLKD